MPTHHKKRLNELTVVAVFFIVVAIGLIFALFNLELAPTTTTGQAGISPPPPPPTLEEYRSEARSILSPFLAQAVSADKDQIFATGQVLTDLIDKTQDRLLRLRVPSEAREAHLSFVLLLEQWKRAMQGSASDQVKAPINTQKVTAANPWLVNE